MLTRIFTWWNGVTIGALMDITRRGRLIGEDDQGNRYYQERRPSRDGKPRRWVVYKGVAEASRIPPDWHGWLHYLFEKPPTEAPLRRQPWEQAHRPNMTGTIYAYRPQGSLARDGEAHGQRDYEPWTPGS